MRIVFMGTPQFAVPALRHLVAAGHSVVAVVTQPDRPVGRSGQPAPPPVKREAEALGIPVLQPERVRDATVIDELQRLAPDVIVVDAFGQILPRALLAIPPHGCLNVHASLLPKYRGAAPIMAAILAGERDTGVTIMVMAPGLDTGPILAQRAEAIRADDTTESLGHRLAEIGAELLVETLPRWLSGQLPPRQQEESEATYVPMLRREAGLVDWSQTASYIDRQCRAYFPWPGCYTHWNNKILKLLAVHPVLDWAGTASPGEVIAGTPGGELLVGTGAGALAIDRLQPEGKRPMSAAEFLRGQGGIVGSVLH